MAKENKKGVAEVAPLFPTLEKKQWVVAKQFHDKLQKKVVKVGEVVEWTKERQDLNLIK